jgi:hypothetical protein
MQALINEIGTQLLNTRQLYQKALEYGRSDHPMRKLDRFFDRETYDSDGLKPEPYAHFLPGVWVGFERGKDVQLNLAAKASQISTSDTAQSVCDVEIIRTGRDETKWLTLEFEVPLHYLRTSQQLSLSIFGRLGGEDQKSAVDGMTMHLSLFVHDTDDVRHNAVSAPFRPTLKLDHGQARCDTQIDLPRDIRIDETRPSVLAIFFPSAARNIVISDIYIDFH